MLNVLLALLLCFARPFEEPVSWAGAVEIPDGTKLEFSVELKHDSGTITIPMQHVKDLPLANVTVTDKQMKFALPSVGAAWELKLSDDGQSASGVLRQGAELKTTLKRLAAGESAVKELKRPQEPKPPFPYETSEVKFENKAGGATLAGTLSLPRGKGPFPCVVMVTGSGPQDRDESLLGHRPFLVIADHLTRAGIAVLRYDDRGIAHSTGNFATATSDDFAADALAGIAFLKTRTELDPRKLGIVGHSEGGLIAPMCAAQSKDVAFIVLLAGTGMRGAELLPLQGKLINLATGMSAADTEREEHKSAGFFALMLAGKSDTELKEAIRVEALKELKAAPESKNLSEAELAKQADKVVVEQSGSVLSPWFKRFVALDPRENLLKVRCPVLALNGEKDLQVPPKENLAGIRKALEEAGNKDVTLRELPGLNHLFQTCKTGSPAEYASIEETFSPLALEAMTAWIRKHTGLD